MIQSVIVMAVVTYLIRMLPIVLFQKKITNLYLQSFLEYMPCVVLSCMTFPAIFTCTRSLAASVVGALAAMIFAWKEKSLIEVAAIAVLGVLFIEILI